jgi:hypothetical protein
MAYKVKKTEHSGPKRGNGAHWGTKSEAKQGSRKLRRRSARDLLINHEWSVIPDPNLPKDPRQREEEIAQILKDFRKQRKDRLNAI